MSGEGSFVRRDISLEETDRVIHHIVMDYLLENSLDDAMGIVMDLYGHNCGLNVKDFKEIRTLENWMDLLISKAEKEKDAKRLHMINSITSALLDHKSMSETGQQPEAAQSVAAPEQGEGGAWRTVEPSHPSLESLKAPIYNTGAAVHRAQTIFDLFLRDLRPDLQNVVVDQIQRSLRDERMRGAVRKMSSSLDQDCAGPAKRQRRDGGDGGDRRNGA